MPKDKPKSAAQGLSGSLGTSKQAQQYFSSLPQYAQEMIMQRREHIKTQDELHSYANNLTQGMGKTSAD